MKIALTGGGTGGHFYPLIAVAQEIRRISHEERLLDPEFFYLAPTPYDADALFEQGIEFQAVSAGKRREYFSLKNFTDLFKIGWGILGAIVRLFFIFPDVIFSKGGYVSVPVLFAARIFRIPVIIHESDSVPGKANSWAASFAKRIAISFPETSDLFKKLLKKNKDAKIALTGNPVRKELLTLAPAGAREFLKLEEGIPVVLILGGSSGAQAINETLIEALPELVERYYVIHQTGKDLYALTAETAKLALGENPHADRYKPFPFLNVLALRMAAGAADVIISRAGASSIFEIALWGKPSLTIPIPRNVSRDQHSNAFAYARSGAAMVIEQGNLTPHLIVSEINRLMDSPAERAQMGEAAKSFARPDAAEKIAREVLDLALEHEK